MKSERVPALQEKDKRLKRMLLRYRAGSLSLRTLLDHVRELPFQDLGFAKVDLHRSFRRGFPEVIYARGKSIEQIVALADVLRASGSPAIVTKVPLLMAQGLRKKHPWLRYFPEAQIAAGPFHRRTPFQRSRSGFVLVVTAGTTDIPVAEEALVTLKLMGVPVRKLFDVGVAGLPTVGCTCSICLAGATWFQRIFPVSRSRATLMLRTSMPSLVKASLRSCSVTP